MKKLLIGLGILAILAGCENDTSKQAIKANKKAYDIAMEMGDVPSALAAAYQILALDSTQEQYYDTIAQLHFAMGNYNTALAAGRKAIKDSTSVVAKEIVAFSSKRTGDYTTAVLYYQELLKDDPEKSIQYQYQIGESFFMMKNLESAAQFMNMVAQNEKSRMLDMEMRTQQGTQKVPYHLAALNTLGYIMMVQDNYDKAEEIFKDILMKKEDFQLAQNNYALLQQLKQEKQQEK